VLSRTGYEKQARDEQDQIQAELIFVKNWLEKYAPDELKFTVQPSLPDAALTDAQRSFLTILASQLSAQTGEISGQAMHELIYAAKDQENLSPKEAFQALYRVILGKDYGPKAGWFLASLDRDWLIRRLTLEA
jgi:lysyl-tRNA synthetase class 1